MATAVSPADRLIPLAAVAKMTKRNIKTVRGWVADGTLPVVKMGPRLTFADISDVERLLTPSAATPAPAVEVPPLPTRDAFAEYIARVVEAAPPLSAEQIDRLTLLLNSAAA